MTNRIISIAVVVLALNALMGCSGGLSELPAAPTSLMPSISATGAQERWSLTRTFTGHAGSEGCALAVDVIGQAASASTLLVQRSAASMRLFTADHNTYVGVLAGNEFLATENESGSTLECGTARIPFRTEARVSGAFSSDGRSLVGKETSVFLFDSGKTITRNWDWRATRD